MAEILRVLKRDFEEMKNRFDRMKNHFAQQNKWFEELKEGTKNQNSQRLAGLQLQAQQPRLAAKADVKQDKNTHDRKKGVAPDERYRDLSSVRIADPMSQASFGDEEFTEPSALTKCSDGALVDEGTKAPKPRLSFGEKRTSTHVGGVLQAGLASTTLRIISPPQPLSWSFCENTEKGGKDTTTGRKTSIDLPLSVA